MGEQIDEIAGGLGISRPERESLFVSTLRLWTHVTEGIDVTTGISQFGKGMKGQIVIAETGYGIEFLDVIIPPSEILLSRSGRQGVHFVMGDLVAKPVRDGVRIGPLHRETLLHIEMPGSPVLLVAVAQEDPFGHSRVQGDRIALRVWHYLGIFLVLVHQHLEEGHDILPMGKGEGLIRIGVIAA